MSRVPFRVVFESSTDAKHTGERLGGPPQQQQQQQASSRWQAAKYDHAHTLTQFCISFM